MKKLNEDLKTTFIFSTHDEKVMQYLNRMVSMKDGAVEKDNIIHNS
jgi:putative ABC transport system ATP-binding protein